MPEPDLTPPAPAPIRSYLAGLAARLPADIVDELADGLHEAYRQHRTRGTGRDAAARAAIAEFGPVDALATAYVRGCPGRRLARLLVATGPCVGLLWGTALLTGRAWTWPVPPMARLAFAAGLATVIATLLLAAFGTRRYRHTTLAAATAGSGLIVLDASMLTAVTLTAPSLAWPVMLAASASVIRISATTRTLAALHSR